MKNPRTLALWTTAMTAGAFVLLSMCSVAQESTPAASSQSVDASLRELDSQVRELRAVIEQMRAENTQSRAEMRELRQELQDTRKLLAPLAVAASAQPIFVRCRRTRTEQRDFGRRCSRVRCGPGKPSSKAGRIHSVAGLED